MSERKTEQIGSWDDTRKGDPLIRKKEGLLIPD